MPVFQSDFAMHSSKRWGEVIRKSETLGWGEERRAEWHNIWRTEWVLVTWSGLRSDVVTECFLRGLDGSQSVLGLGCAPISAVSGGWELRADITWAPVMRISCWSQLRRTRRDRGPRYQRGGGIIERRVHQEIEGACWGGQEGLVHGGGWGEEESCELTKLRHSLWIVIKYFVNG